MYIRPGETDCVSPGSFYTCLRSGCLWLEQPYGVCVALPPGVGVLVNVAADVGVLVNVPIDVGVLVGVTSFVRDWGAVPVGVGVLAVGVRVNVAGAVDVGGTAFEGV